MRNSTPFLRFVIKLLLQVISGVTLMFSGSAFAATYTWNNTNNTLLIQLATNESIAVNNAGGNTSFTLSSGVFTQSGGDAATGSGTDAITIVDEDLAASVTINNTSAGAGTNNVSFSGSGSLASTTITINVAQAGTTAAISSSAGFTLIATTLTLQAATGVGTLAASLNTDLDNVEATTATGGVFLSNTGALTVGGVNGTLEGMKVTGASGAIQIVASGTMTIIEPIKAPGTITLKTTGSSSDLVLAHGVPNGIESTNGITTLESGHDILCGTAAGFGDASGQGTVLLAGNDIIIDATTYVQANGMQGLSATAGRDFKILRTFGVGSVFNNNAGNSPVTITTGAGGSFVLDQGSDGGVGANGGTIIINTDNCSVLSGATSTTNTITLRPVTAGRAINLGTEVSGQLSLTDTELDQFIGGTLIIGSAVSGIITVSAGITRSAATDMQLLSGSEVSINGGSINTISGNVTINADDISVLSGPVTTTGTVTVIPVSSGRAINLGTEAAGQLSLTDTELDQIIGGTLIIGSAVSGTITVSAGITRLAATNMQLLSAGDVSISGGVINTNGGTLLLDPGTTPAAVKPTFNGTDVSASTLSFGSDLSLVINGTTPGNGTGATYTQLTVAGTVNLMGVDLLLTGTHVPVIGQTFMLVDNDDTDAIVGTFTGLDEGTIINNFLSSSLKASITYSGGSGNDVVITVLAPPAFTLSPISKAVCTGTGTTFTVTATNTASYQWQVDMGSGFTNLSNTPPYSNVTTPALSISNATGLNGYQYRAVATGTGGITESDPATLTVDLLQTITLTSAPATESQTLCVNSPITPITYALGGGATGITPITGLPAGVTSSITANVLTISGSPITVVGSPFNYSIATTGNTCPGATESGTITVSAQLTVPTLNAQMPNATAICFGTGVSATFNAGSGGLGCSDDFILIIDNGAPVAYTPGSTVGTTAIASIVIQGRRANCSVGSGCSGTNYVTLASWTVNPIPTATISGTTQVCQDAPSANITFTGIGGTAPYTFTYSINGGGSQMVATVSGNSATVFQSTNSGGIFTYTLLSVSDVNCSQNQSKTAIITVLAKPTITLTALGQTLLEGNSQTLCDTDADSVNGLKFTVPGSCAAGIPVWRVQAGNEAWSNWSNQAPATQPSDNQTYRYQAACDANCASTFTGTITLTINYRASTPQNVSLAADGTSVVAGESKTICNLEGNALTFNATCASGEILLYSVDGSDYSTIIPSQIVDGNFHNYRVRCRKADYTTSCVESESAVMSLKITTAGPTPTVSISPASSCGTPTAFSGSSNCGVLTTIWYNAATNQALPTLPAQTPDATTSYYARCQSTGSAGEAGCLSEQSNTVTFTITPVNDPPTVTASAEIVCTGTQVTISANCPAGASTFWNTGVTTPSFQVAFSNVTKQTYWAKCIFPNSCQSSESTHKTIFWKAFELTFINIGQSQSAIKPANDRSLWIPQFITPDAGPVLENSTEANPTIYHSENVNKTAPRFWTIQVETCALGTNGSVTYDMLAAPEVGVVRSYNTHENNAPYLMYANREGFTELYAQNHPAYGFYQDNGSGGNTYDAGLPKGLYKLGIRYWDQKGQGSIYPSTRQPAGNVLAYQEYWFRIQSQNGIGTGSTRLAKDNGQWITDNEAFAQVAPNPVSKTLHLKVNEAKAQKVDVTLLDASGRMLLQRSFTPQSNQHQEEFEVSNLSNSMYFLRVITADKQTTLKVVKVE